MCATMPRSSPFPIRLSAAESAELRRRAAKYTLPYFQVQRAKMILMAAEGLENSEIAARLNTRRDVVSEWRKRFFLERLPGLEERARPGRPRTFPLYLRTTLERGRAKTRDRIAGAKSAPRYINKARFSCE